MALALQHAMQPRLLPEDVARGRFVSALRRFVLNDLAHDMRQAYETRVAPAYQKANGRLPETSAEVHMAMRGDIAFNTYSSCRVQAQKMVWSSVKPVVAREREAIEAAAGIVEGSNSVSLDPELAVPRNVSALDVHLMPGGYVGDPDFPLEAGAIYDQGLAIFSMGLMGQNLDDIGQSMAGYISNAYPDFRPAAILDVGCTIGHNTVPWKKAYPDADVHAVDVSAPGLIYGAARAAMQDADIHFHQMDAERLAFPDGSFDLIFTSMFLHELSKKTRVAFFREAHRLLRPGGLLLNMELPPNSQVGAFEGFYLDWDCYYNKEPYYKGFRDEEPLQLCEAGGFTRDSFLQFVVPSVGIYGEEAVREAAQADHHDVNRETTGRLADGVQWFGFGARKEA